MWNLLLLNAILFLFILFSAPAGTGVIMSDNKHLTLDNRYDIQHFLDDGLSFKAIALKLGKDCSTISKEVKRHIIFKWIKPVEPGVPMKISKSITKNILLFPLFRLILLKENQGS